MTKRAGGRLANWTVKLARPDQVLSGPTEFVLPAELTRLNLRRAFLVVSGSLNSNTGSIKSIVAALGPRCVGVFDRMPSHTPDSAVVQCANVARSLEADAIVSIGGGSVTDGAKAVALCVSNRVDKVEKLPDYYTKVDANGVRAYPEYPDVAVKIICVPTTLSGGEFNSRAGITDTENRIKRSFDHRSLMPCSIILDSQLACHTPSTLFLTTGVRAIDHAVETLCSLDANPYTDGLAIQALRLLGPGLRGVAAGAEQATARLDCMVGAWMSMTGIVGGMRMGGSHAIGHVLGAAFGVPHGMTSCITLPAVLEWNEPATIGVQQGIAREMGFAGEALASGMHRFIAELGLPRRLSDVGVGPEHLELAAEKCLKDDWIYSNPVPLNKDSIVQILRKCL